MSGQTKISVYPVGALYNIQTAYRAVTTMWRWDLARTEFRDLRRYTLTRLRERNWRALKNEFNGYLAEIDYPCDHLAFRTCGHGWTKRRAARRLGEYLTRDNSAEGEAERKREEAHP